MLYRAFFCSTRILIASLLPISVSASQSKACYLPNGVDVNLASNVTEGWYFAPCNNVATASMCCATGPGRNSFLDACRPDGLCYNNFQASYWRESCTDPTWKDPACIKLFVNGSSGTANARLTPCPDGSWCSGVNNTGCCAAKQGVLLSSLQANPTPVNSTANTTTAVSATSSTASPTEAAPSTTQSAISPRRLSTGAKIGLSVGVTMAGLLLIILVAFIVLRRRKSSRHSRPTENDGASQDSQEPTQKFLRSMRSNESAVEMTQPSTSTYAATINGRAITNGKSVELPPTAAFPP